MIYSGLVVIGEFDCDNLLMRNLCLWVRFGGTYINNKMVGALSQ